MAALRLRAPMAGRCSGGVVVTLAERGKPEQCQLRILTAIELYGWVLDESTTGWAAADRIHQCTFRTRCCCLGESGVKGTTFPESYCGMNNHWDLDKERGYLGIESVVPSAASPR